jgi:hypothetical protein
MKTIIFFALLLLTVLISSCSDENTIDLNQDNPIVISHYIQKNYDLSGSVLRTIEYTLADDRIVNSLSTVVATAQTSNSVYTYSNDKLVSISNYVSGNLTTQSNYQYNSNGDLIEMVQNSFNSANQIATVQKHTFTHTSDTIFSQWNRSTDGGATFSVITNLKIVLDQNKNRVFFEDNSTIDENIERVISAYDSNHNLINEQYVTEFPTGVTSTYPTNLYTYTNQINPLAIAIEATYGRKTFMMLYHLQTNALNNINARNCTPNTMQSFSTDFGNGTITFEIENTPFNATYTKISDYKTFNSGALFSRFSLEYFFE